MWDADLWVGGTKDTRFADAIIKVIWKGETTEFRVHKLILAKKSQKFQKLFYDEHGVFKHTEIPTVQIKKFPPTIVKRILEYIYTGKGEGGEITTWEEFGGLIEACKEYGVRDLEKLIIDKLNSKLNPDAALFLLQNLSDDFKIRVQEHPVNFLKQMLKLLLSFILRNAEKAIETGAFKQLNSDNLRAVLSSDFLYVRNELMVFQAIDRWAIKRCKEDGLDADKYINRRKVLRRDDEDENSFGALELVRFRRLRNEDFDAFKIRKKGYLPTKLVEKIEDKHSASVFLKPRLAPAKHPEEFKSHVESLAMDLIKKLRRNAQQDEQTPSPGQNDYDIPLFEWYSTASQGEMNNNNLPEAKVKPEDPKQMDILQISQKENQLWWNSENSNDQTLRKIRKRSSEDDQPLSQGKSSTEEANAVVKGIQLSQPKISRSDPCQKEAALSQNCGPVACQEEINVNEECLRFTNFLEERCINTEMLRRIRLSKVQLHELTGKITKPSFRSSVRMPNLRYFLLDAFGEGVTWETFTQQMKETYFEDYIFFYPRLESLDIRLAEIWTHKVILDITLNNTKICASDPYTGSLTLNLMKYRLPYLLNTVMTETLTHLNIGNCMLHEKHWLPPNVSAQLRELRLFKVCALYVDSVIQQCEALEKLVIWPPEIGRQPTVVTLQHFPRSLKKFAARNTIIKYVHVGSDPAKPVPLLSTMCLDNCRWDDPFMEEFQSLFPSLDTIFVNDAYGVLVARFVSTLMNMISLREITVLQFKMKYLDSSKFKNVKTQLKDLGLRAVHCEEGHFILHREGNRRSASDWRLKNVDRKDFPAMFFKNFEIRKFYALKVWEKHIWKDLYI